MQNKEGKKTNERKMHLANYLLAHMRDDHSAARRTCADAAVPCRDQEWCGAQRLDRAYGDVAWATVWDQNRPVTGHCPQPAGG